MKNIDKVIEAFVNGDYFILFLVIILVVLLVLVLALIKTREEYNELLVSEQKKDKEEDIIEQMDNSRDEDDLMSDLTSLMASTKEDTIDANKPLIKQIDLSTVKSYEELMGDYELSEEENAVISADELEKRKEERLEALGSTENQEIINKYEEEQEKKAIISYEQLMQNASNISLSYKEEDLKDKDEIEQKEVTKSQMYIEEEEFLKILKEFRISLE